MESIKKKTTKYRLKQMANIQGTILKVEAATAAAEYAKRQADSLKHSRFDLSDTTKNKRQIKFAS